MRNVPPLAHDDVKLFDDIAAAKHQPRRGRLQTARATVLAGYGDYEAVAPDLQNLTAVVLTDSQRDALIHAFEAETAPLAAVRGALLERPVVARCPFCSLSESSTLDHYLPKQANPLFAVFTKNLVPCCSQCNTHKGDRILDEGANSRFFLHPCYDTIPNQRFVKVDIVLTPDVMGLTFRIIRPAGMVQPMFRRLRSHFELLDLANRYRVMSLEHLRDQRRALARLYGPTEDASKVATEMAAKADDFERDYGPNYWLCVLYRTLAVHEQFCAGGFAVLNQIQ